MMPGRAGRYEGDAPASAYGVDGHQAGSGSQARCIPRRSVGIGVRVEGATAEGTEPAQLIEVGGGVDAPELLDGRGASRKLQEITAEVEVRHTVHDRPDPSRSFGMAVFHVFLGRHRPYDGQHGDLPKAVLPFDGNRFA